jgi:hypothetical protein
MPFGLAAVACSTRASREATSAGSGLVWSVGCLSLSLTLALHSDGAAFLYRPSSRCGGPTKTKMLFGFDRRR